MIDYELLRAEVARHPYPLLFATVSGAHLYGFPSPDSDCDLRGAHVLPVPARRESGRPCHVRMRSCRETTMPATIPKPTCEVTNRSQSIRWLSTGFTIPRMLWSRPDHRTGATKPPSRIGRRGSIGSVAP